MRRDALLCVTLGAILCLAGINVHSVEPAKVRIGSHLAGAWPGITTIVDDEAAFLCRVGWVDKDGVHRDTGIDTYYTTHKQPYLPWIPQIRRVWVGPTAPDNSFSELSWEVNAGRLELQWGRTGESAVVGKLTATAAMRITLENREQVNPLWRERGQSSGKPTALEAGKEYEVKIEYFHPGGPHDMVFTWHRLSDEKDGLLSNRIGGTSLYPLLSGAADAEQGRKAIAYLTSPATLWGEYVVPTTSRGDPTFNEMEYWRGRIWAPSSYLAYQSIKDYAPADVRREYARKCVTLFMRNWNSNGASWENYTCNGEGGNAPHYVWGALLNLIAIEEIVDIEDDGRVRLNGTLEEDLELRNVPIHGTICDVKVRAGVTQLLKNGKVVAESRGEVKRIGGF